MIKFRLGLIALISIAMAGCENHNQPASSSSALGSKPTDSNAAANPPNSVTERWMGKWIGPEGTYLVLSRSDQKYVVEIHSLDGSASYDGVAAGDRIEFQRNGKTEFVHAGNGQDTGMKWLMDKQNCLIIQTGEGFCRD
jgi:hypothetical protein